MEGHSTRERRDARKKTSALENIGGRADSNKRPRDAISKHLCLSDESPTLTVDQSAIKDMGTCILVFISVKQPYGLREAL